MLRSLRDIQSAFAAHLAGDDRPDLVSAIDGNPRTAVGRLQLHRQQTALSLTSALAATYPKYLSAPTNLFAWIEP